MIIVCSFEVILYYTKIKILHFLDEYVNYRYFIFPGNAEPPRVKLVLTQEEPYGDITIQRGPYYREY
jgi:hypothetical protein